MIVGEPVIEPPEVKRDAHAGWNLQLNMVALVLSSLLTATLGLGFWVAAGRLLPEREVGVAAALITTAVMLATLSNLSIDTLYERFLPLAGNRTGVLLKHGFLLVAAAAVLSGLALVAFGPRERLFDSGWAMAGYPLLVMVIALFALQDGATVGLGVARWSAAKNSLHAVAKFVALLALVWTHSAMSIVVAWGVTAAIIALVVLVALRRRFRSNARFLVPPTLPPRTQLWSYFGSSFGITAVWAIGPLVVPLIVITQVGAEANAHFAIAWAMINALYLTVHLVVSPYVAEAAGNLDEIHALSWRMIRMVAAVACVGSVGLVVIGPILLGLVGTGYRADGTALLYIAAVFVPLSAVGAVYDGLARVHRRLRLLLVMRAMATLFVVVGSLIGARALGVIGVGWAYLAAEAITAAAALGPIILWLKRIKHTSDHAGSRRNVRRGPASTRGSRNALAGVATICIAALLALQAVGIPPEVVRSPDARLTAASTMFDDFDGPAGSLPDPHFWTYETGAGLWGNNESQTYTTDPANVRLDGAGHLVIEVHEDGGQYTSARLITKDRIWLRNGRAEARIQLPRGAGLHPAFWLLGRDVGTVGWPQSGEIDVVETIDNAEVVYSALHGPDVNGAEWDVTKSAVVGPSFVDEFHTYWLQKEPGRITTGVDDRVTANFRMEDLPPDDRWVFDKEFFIILNVAVGGDWPGPVESSTPFPVAMTVDWVRVTND